MTLDTATATVSKHDEAFAKADDIKKLAMLIASACIQKLGLDKRYTVNIRWYAAPCPFPFVEIGVTPIGKPIETHEFSVIKPAAEFLCADKEERSALAASIFKQIQLGVMKWDSK